MATGSPPQEDDGFLCGFFHAAIVSERPPLSSGWTLPFERIVSEKVAVGYSRNLEFRELRQNGADRNARFEGDGFGIGRPELREGGKNGGRTALSIKEVGMKGMAGRNRRIVMTFRTRHELRKFTEDVVGRGYALGRTVANERIRSKASRADDVARDGEHFLSKIEGEFGGDEASGFFARLRHERSVGIAGDERVADGKMVRHGSRARSESRNYRAARGHDRIEQVSVGTGIIDVYSCSYERDGRSSSGQCGGMRFGIDSCGTARNDDRTMANEGRNETFGHLFAVRRSLSRTDDRKRKRGLRDFSSDIEQKRPPRHVAERGRVFVVMFTHHARSDGLGVIESPDCGILKESGDQGFGSVVTDSGIRKEFAECGFGDGDTVFVTIRSDVGRKVRESLKGV